MPARSLFADSFYWIALIFPRDAYQAAVVAVSRSLSSAQLVTTDEVLGEVLNHFGGLGPYWRTAAAALVRDVRSDARIDVLSQSQAGFDTALTYYEARPDKEYSLVDCRSMVAMRTLGITEVLTNDHHFAQEGFTILFP